MVWGKVLSGFIFLGWLSLVCCQPTSPVKECKPFKAPKNGAARCYAVNDDLMCTVACQASYDFEFNPAQAYFCVKGKWDTWSMKGDHDSRLPWSDCKKRSTPSSVKLHGLPQFFFHGDCQDPNVQAKLKQDSIQLMSPPHAPPFFCVFNPQCTAQNTRVYCGMNQPCSKI